MSQNTNESSVKEILFRLGDWWKYIISKWLLISVTILLGSTIGFIYASYKKPTFIAELSFVLEDEKSNGSLGGAIGLASQFGFDLGGNGGGVFSGDNLLELMKSRSIIEKVLLTTVPIQGKKQTLADSYLSIYGLKKNWDKEANLKDLRFEDMTQSSLVRQKDSILIVLHRTLIKNHLTVAKTDKKLDIITVKVSSISEAFSKCFTEVLVDEVSNFYIETRTKKAAQNLAILKHQTDSVRSALNSAISGVAISSDINPNPNFSMQILRVPSQRRQVDVQANQAILTELVKNLEIAKVSLRKETPLIQIIDRPVFPLQKQEIGKFKGIILGGLICTFLSVMIILCYKIWRDIINGLHIEIR